MTDIKVTQGSVYSLTGDGNMRLSQVAVYGLSTEPASEINVVQSTIYGVTSGEVMPMKVTNASVYALAKRAAGQSKIRTWGFNLDGHDFYVIQLGLLETLVFDLTTKQWFRWNSPGQTVLRVQRGMNWQGYCITQAEAGYTWNIVAGDFQTPNLWIMDPAVGIDEHPFEDEDDLPFRREAVANVPARGREPISVHQVYLTMNLGEPQLSGADITLYTSDDEGQTWLDHGAITVTPDDYDQEFVWHGLGLITAPGRIFKLVDEGAAVRISSLESR